MNTPIPFEAIDWSQLPVTIVNGTTGTATMRVVQHGGLRIRMVEYSADYLADHWCQLGHLVFVLEGELINDHEDGRVNVLKAGMSYHVSDGLSSHRSRTNGPVKLIVVDGAFLG
ncbi:MAG TPA: DHCW motif cupin fold protein [Flavobacteriales bacterium]|nr:DHCW motif cupin fold protein [Flavobacteriales bacterium]